MKASEILTLSGIEDLMRKRITNGKRPPKNWEKLIEGAITLKEGMFEKAKDPNFGKSIDVNVVRSEISTMLHIKTFLGSENIEIPRNIHPAGILQNGLIIIPITPLRYVYNLYGLRGIAEIKQWPESKQWYMDIEGNQVNLTEERLEDLDFEPMDEKLSEKWVKKQAEHHTTKKIWDYVENYFRNFGDVPEICYKALTYFVFQTYLQDIEDIDSVFYLSIMGGFGSGKSTLLELLQLISYRGMIGNASTAVIARSIDEQRTNIFFDELDSTTNEDDNENFSLIRQGYRKGMNYIRMSADNKKRLKFKVFGSKAFSIHSITESALLQRSIPINTIESTDSTLPEVNSIKHKIAKLLRDKLYLWYLDNILLIVDTVCCVDYVGRVSFDDLNRKNLMELVRLNWSSTESTTQRYGRSGEIAFVLRKLAFLLGVELDASWSTEIFEMKQQVEDEQQETNDVQILRDILVDKYRELAIQPTSNGWRTPEDYVKVSQKEINKIFNDKMKVERSKGANAKDFAGYLRELKFQTGVNKKPMRIRVPNETVGAEGAPSRTALIFNGPVLKKLGIKAIEAPDQETTEEKV